MRVQVRSADGTPVTAALGLAVVDQAVLERSRTDNEFGHRRWFECAFCADDGEREIAGIRLNDLYAIPAEAPLSSDLDLVAEALVANVRAAVASESSEDFNHAPAFLHLSQKIKNLAALVDQSYAKSFEYPRTSRRLKEFSGANGPV